MVEVFVGIVIVNVAVDVLSEPKSKTAIDLLPLDTLYIRAHRAVKAEVQDTLFQLTYAVYPSELIDTPVMIWPPAV